MSLDSRIDRLMADEQLDTACQAITASVAMLRATELQLHEVQDRQGFSPEEATLLCEQVVALRDLLKLRLGEMNSGATLDGSISRGPSPSRVTAGSRAAASWVVEQQQHPDRGASVPPMRASAEFTQKKGGERTTRRRASAESGQRGLLPRSTPQLVPLLCPTRTEAEAEALPLLETISAVLIDLDGTMYSPPRAHLGRRRCAGPPGTRPTHAHISPPHPLLQPNSTPRRDSPVPDLVSQWAYMPGPGSRCSRRETAGHSAPSTRYPYTVPPTAPP